MALVSLQINLAPVDYPYARVILPHQLQVLAEQCSEVVLVIDLHRSRGRFGGWNWDSNRDSLASLIQTLKHTYPTVSFKVHMVEYSKSVRRQVSQYFFTQGLIPRKDYRGGPYYSYLYGLYRCENDLVFHVDSDIIFGGRSQTWIDDAVELLSTHADLLCVSPHMGPPVPPSGLAASELDCSVARQHKFATRAFLIDRRQLQNKLHGAFQGSRLSCLLSILRGRLPFDFPEMVITRKMRADRMFRGDFRGPSPGLWTLHPLYKDELFCKLAASIIERASRMDLPPQQLSECNLCDLIHYADTNA
jgi:hypothetical protein